MPVTIRGKPFSTLKELLETSQRDVKRYSYLDVPSRGKKAGTLDATSCLGVIYRTEDKSTYVQHHDGRSLQTMLSVFADKSFSSSRVIRVTLVGGCSIGQGSNGVPLLEKHTHENVEGLLAFWKGIPFSIDLQGWFLGNASSYETLCSDFLVDEETVYLLKQGEMGRYNLENSGKLIPYAERRLAATLLDNSRYFFVSSHAKTLELPALKNLENLREFAQFISKHEDEFILKHCSTTPNLEPPYFPQLLRNMAAYVLLQKGCVPAVKEVLLDEYPVIALQGELVKLCSHN